MADFSEVAALLHIHEKAAAHGDLLKNIADSAMAKLKQINEEHGKPEPAEESEEEEADHDA